MRERADASGRAGAPDAASSRFSAPGALRRTARRADRGRLGHPAAPTTGPPRRCARKDDAPAVSARGLFGIGVVPGFVTTVIFALPPGVRLTGLGVRQVDAEVVEAGTAFGGSPRQVLRGIQLPLALPTIMAGINQVIMLALSMAVVAGFIGAPGLGSDVVRSIASLDLGLGFEAGLSVVVLAIFLDRLTASFGTAGAVRGRLSRARAMLGRGSTSSSGDDDLTPEVERQR